MRHLSHADLHTEPGPSNNCDRVGARILYVDGPWFSMGIDSRRMRWKLDDCRRIEELNQVTAILIGNEVLIRTQMNHGLVLQRMHLARKKRQINEPCFHRMPFESFLRTGTRLHDPACTNQGIKHKQPGPTIGPHTLD